MSQNTNTAKRRDMLTPYEISDFCVQAAMVLKAGIPVSEGLRMMCEDVTDTRGKGILQGMWGAMEEGQSLHGAMVASGVFPPYAVHMVEIGETTGKLETVLESLSDYYEREQAVSKSIRSAVTYPLVMVGMMLLVIGVLIVKVLPIFNQVYAGLGGEMPAFSMALLRFGQGLGRYAVIIIGFLAAIALVMIILNVTNGGKRLLSRWKTSFFLTKNLYRKIAAGRFASAMALTLSSGLDSDQSLELVTRLVDYPEIQARIGRCQDQVKEGASFSQALVSAEIFSGVYGRMVSVGFKTGSLDTVMQKLADRYQEETDAQIGNVISILEPTMVAVLSVVVGMILLSVMLPLMGIMSSIG